MKNRWWIYVLEDPRTDEVRYVGRSKDPRERLQHHTKPIEINKPSHRARWLKQLVEDGLRPRMRIIDAGAGLGIGVKLSERAWIREYWRRGASLTNSTDSIVGRVRYGERSQQSRELNRIAQTGRKASAEARARMSAARKGRPRPPQEAARIAAANVERNKSDAHRSIVGALRRGVPKSAEQREKISAALRGRSLSEEHKRSISAGLIGVNKGRKHTAEARERIRQGCIRREQRKAKGNE